MKSLQYLNRLAPTLRFQTMGLDPQWTQKMMSNLIAVSASPFVASNLIGIDGVSYEVYQGDYMNGTSMRWWCEGPEDGGL